MRHTLIVAALLCASANNVADAVVAFDFSYTDSGTGTGFDDPLLGADRRSALQHAADTFATAFSSYNATIQMAADGNSPAGSLASTDIEYGGPLTTGFGNHEVIRNKVISNGTMDLNNGATDGTINLDFSAAWELDFHATPTAAQYDFYSTVYHELAHAMGFASAIFTVNGIFATDYRSRTTGQWAKFDEYLSDVNGNSVFSGVTLNASTYESLLIGGASPAGGLYFNGSGGLVGLYSPSTFLSGSSGSHLDDENPGLANNMMLSFISTGPSVRTFSEIERGMLRDIGYTSVGQITAIPEPSALIMVALAFLSCVWLKRLW